MRSDTPLPLRSPPQLCQVRDSDNAGVLIKMDSNDPDRIGGNPKRRKLNTAKDDPSTSRNHDNGKSWKWKILTHKKIIIEDIMLLLF